MVALRGNKSAPAKKGSAGGKKPSSSEKELQHLRRVELLELLWDEIRANEENSTKLVELTDLTARLKSKLDDKDAQIEHLKERLDAKDAKIAELEERVARLADANAMITTPGELAEIERRVLEEFFNKKVESARHSR